MRSEESCKLFGVVVERDLVVTLVGVEDGVPPLPAWERANLLPGRAFRIAGPDAELVKAAKINAESHLARTFLGDDNNGMQPVVGFWSLLDGFEDSSVDLLQDFVLERLKVSLGDSTMSTGRRWDSILA
jgi:hypothetical protein